MQIVQVVPNVRTQKEAIFDYSIPPELLPMIKVGILVEIPFHGRKIEGIIVNIKRSSNIFKLKEILKIIDSSPVVDNVHIKLAEWISDYYLSPLGKTLFENIVPPAKRTIKKGGDYHVRYLSKSAGADNNRQFFSKKYLKKYLLTADFPTRLKYYLVAIKRTISQNKAVIILIPDLSFIPYFTKYIKNPIGILHAGMTKTQRWLEWDKIRRGEVNIVIGSQSALFAPAVNLGLIIIDQEENETYKNDRSPRFHAVGVAQKLSDLTDANLILGSLVPKIETYYQATQGKFRILRKAIIQKSNISIVDMNSEKYVISNTLEKEIENTLLNKTRTLLVLNRKGEGTKFSCADCGWMAMCEKCGLPLVPQKTDNVCFRCEKTYLQPASCPKCRSIKLRPMGLGTIRLKKFINDLFPKAKVIQVEKDIDGRLMRSDWDIAITTTYGLKFGWSKIRLVGIIDADQGLNFPDFNSPQKSFQTLFKFLRIGERGIVQTHLPENYIISTLARLDYERFFLDEIIQRRKYGFPPFTHLVRLLFKSVDNEKVLKETARIYQPLITNHFPLTTISPPHACFIQKERGKYRWQIVIKSSEHISHFSSLISIIRSLPKGWIVDVDPVNLL